MKLEVVVYVRKKLCGWVDRAYILTKQTNKQTEKQKYITNVVFAIFKRHLNTYKIQVKGIKTH